MAKKFLSLLAFIFIISCDTNDDKPTNLRSGTYSFSEVEVNEDRLFAKAGEIKDKTIIENFIEKNDHSFFFKDASDDLPEDNFSIEFVSEEKVRIQNGMETEIYNLVERSGVICFESLEFVPSLLLNEEKERKNFLKFSPPVQKIESEVPGQLLTAIKPCIYGRFVNNTIEIPYALLGHTNTYKPITVEEDNTDNIPLPPGVVQKVSIRFGSFNEFNEGSISKLRDNRVLADSLVLRQYKLILKR